MKSDDAQLVVQQIEQIVETTNEDISTRNNKLVFTKNGVIEITT